ncbi:MAG: PA2779 family protein [Porticoccaceae bacterium]|jgi:hypothetical protein|nr:PA2779 family protein [Porticoccaceae bacterium]MEA3300573.1 PA2779 family protein [Pseudomonadota bacterium]HLS97768.1 PA2779 family protein [Porticoccaceae bacterium]
MTTHTLNLRSIVYFVVLFFSLAAVQVPAHAALIGTDSLVSQAELQQQRDALAEQLLRDDVKKELLTLGVDPADVTERVNGMTQSEIQQVQGQLDSLPAGSGLGTVAVVLLILILLEVAGVIDIFPKL